MENQPKQEKELKDFKILYDWLRIARKPYFSLKQDIRLLMELIQIPMTKNQLDFLIKIIDPEGKKKQLEEQDLINCFVVPEEKKKPKEKQLSNAFKHLAKGEDEITLEKLKECLHEQKLDQYSVELILKQISDYETGDGKFDYKKFAAQHTEK